MIQTLQEAEALKLKCDGSTSMNELAQGIDAIDTFIAAKEGNVIAADRERDKWKGIGASEKLEKKTAEMYRDSLKRQLSILRSEHYAQRP